MNKMFLVLFSCLAVSCSTINVSYDYDKSVDFTKYKTYAFSEDAAKLGVSDLNRDRILKSIEAELEARGITKSDNPDALIDLMLKAQEKVEAVANTTGAGMYGRGRYGYGGGTTTTTVDYNKFVEGTLFINLVDKASEKIVWQGRGTKTLDESASPEKRDSNIKYAVKMIFAKYPVKPASK
jgi:hypothetical protein